MRVRKFTLIKTLAVLMLSGCWVVHLYAQTGAGRWYKGDLHTHSDRSDGKCPVKRVIENAESLGFDFFALTDHDTYGKDNHTHWFDNSDYHSEKMVLLYGIEWTSDLGHANIESCERTPFSAHGSGRIFHNDTGPGMVSKCISIRTGCI